MRKPWQYTLLGAVIAFFVLYGIELSSDGMEDVYGPLEPQTADRAGTGSGNGYRGDPYPAANRGSTAEPRQEGYSAWPDDAYRESGAEILPERNGHDALPDRNEGYDDDGYSYEGGASGGAVSRLADGTAGLLQSAAKGGIRFIVSLFESVTK